MSYRARAYPYPVLSSFSQDFGPDARLDANMELEVGGDHSQAVTLRYAVNCSSEWLNEYIIDGKARLALDVESRSTLFREYIDLDQLSGTMTFEPGQLFGAVTITPLIISNTENDNYKPMGIHSEFGHATFSVHPGDILGVGESTTLDLEFARSLDRDLIVIKYSQDSDLRDIYRFDFSGPRIIIEAGENLQIPIGHMRANPSTRPYLFMSIYKDCIVGALNHLFDDGDGEETDLSWGRALLRKIDELDTPKSLDPGDPLHREELAQLLVASRGIKKVEAAIA